MPTRRFFAPDRAARPAPSGRRMVAVLALVTMLFSGTACSNQNSLSNGSREAAEESAAAEGTITVFAAASLNPAFDDLAAAFEAANPGSRVTVSYTGSNTLASQLIDGAPADVFASADVQTMQRVVAAKVASDPATFATNTMAILVAPNNPHNITGLASLADGDVAVALCDVRVPCGAYADAVLSAADVDVTPRTLEVDVNGVATKVIAGEVDAGLAYTSTATEVDDLADSVPIPSEVNVIAEYQIAPVGAAPPIALSFIDFVTGPIGRQALADYGLESPPQS